MGECVYKDTSVQGYYCKFQKIVFKSVSPFAPCLAPLSPYYGGCAGWGAGGVKGRQHEGRKPTGRNRSYRGQNTSNVIGWFWSSLGGRFCPYGWQDNHIRRIRALWRRNSFTIPICLCTRTRILSVPTFAKVLCDSAACMFVRLFACYDSKTLHAATWQPASAQTLPASGGWRVGSQSAWCHTAPSPP